MRGSVGKRGRYWSYLVDVGRDPISGKRKQHRQSNFRTRVEAEAALSRFLSEYNSGSFADAGDLTVAEFLRRWLKSHELGLAPATKRRYTGVIEQHVIPVLGRMPLKKLQAIHLQEFIDHELVRGRRDNKKTTGPSMKPSSVLYEARVLHKAFGQAVRWRLLSQNPAHGLTLPKVPRRRLPEVPDEKKVRRLLESVRGTYLYLPTYLAVYTGMRLGEILGLTWENVDEQKCQIHVLQASIQRKAGSPAFRQPKSRTSLRSIDVTPAVIETLRKSKVEQATWRLRAGTAWQEFELVCCQQDGTPLNPPSVSSAFRSAARRVDLPISFHRLRHTHASLLVKAGVPIKVISDRLGHSSITITMDTYSHLLPGMGMEAAKKLDELLARASV